MATDVVVVDNVLCFLLARFGKTGNKQITSTVLDFYDFSDIYQAKRHLLEAVEQWKSDINLPHIPVRREGEQRNAKTFDDIMTIMTCLDEHLKLSSLPRYVATSPDTMPSTRIYDGDLLTLMSVLDRMRGRMGDIEASLSAILKAVNMPSDKSAPVMDSGQARSVLGSVEPAINNIGQRGHSSVTVTVVNTKAVEIETRPKGNSQQHTDLCPCLCMYWPLIRDWANTVESVSASNHLPLQNKFSVLSRYEDDKNVSNQNNSNRFIEYRPKSSKRSRYHSREQAVQNVHSQSQSQPSQHQQLVNTSQALQGNQNHSQRSGRNLLTGQKKFALPGQRCIAGKSIIKKAVFCVDNVDPSVTVDDLRLFVAGLTVQVVSCFSVRPRRRRNESESDPLTDRKAFRLCILAADRDRLLDESKWPESIIISEWFHVNQADKRQKLNQRGPGRTDEDARLTSINNCDSDRHSATVTAAAAAAADSDSGGGDLTPDVMDTTDTTGADLAVAICGEDQVTSINQHDGEC